jgi:hypothetical protein
METALLRSHNADELQDMINRGAGLIGQQGARPAAAAPMKR